jgi:hypothetical protein
MRSVNSDDITSLPGEPGYDPSVAAAEVENDVSGSNFVQDKIHFGLEVFLHPGGRDLVALLKPRAGKFLNVVIWHKFSRPYYGSLFGRLSSSGR